MMKKLTIIIPILIVIFVIGISISGIFDLEQKETEKEESKPVFQDNVRLSVEQTKSDRIKLQLKIKSLFNMYVFEGDYEIINGKKVWQNAEFVIKPENVNLYEEIGVYNDNQKSVVIFPIFTAAAYSEPGFYTHFRGECDEKCLTVELKDAYAPTFPVSGNGFQVFTSLGYETISDIDVDQNPSTLEQYDKVILLHNEYVTKRMFNAITNHPNVIYLYPNAMYAEVEFNEEENTITLIRGHNYPETHIANGFDWQFDNNILEYNTDCSEMGFDKIDNGWMLNCYPENEIHKNPNLLKLIKNF